MTTDLAEFLRARIAEDKDHARILTNAAKFIDAQPDFYGAGGPAAQDYWQHYNPDRMLGDVEAKRLIISQHLPVGTRPVCLSNCHTRAPGKSQTWPCLTLRLMALPYAGHEDYREEWRPGPLLTVGGGPAFTAPAAGTYRVSWGTDLPLPEDGEETWQVVSFDTKPADFGDVGPFRVPDEDGRTD